MTQNSDSLPVSGSTPRGYGKLLGEIKERIRAAQYAALRAVNTELVILYWDIGRMIVERQAMKKWGRAVVEKLAGDLQKEFPGVKGYSAANLWLMRGFYLAYRDKEKLKPLVREIAWTHNLIIFQKCKDDLQREFYIRMTRERGLTKPVLIHHIENRSYEKTLLNQVNFEKTLPEKDHHRARLAIRDEYVFDFLELGDEFTERQLETGILAKVGPFLHEMGGIFAFVGNQFRLKVGEKEFFVDLLLYHRRLKCLVAIELKVGEFLPEYVGKMQFYLAVLDDRVREADENASIGIILCRSKDRTVVEYALRDSNKPIGVASYRTVTDLPAELRGELPSPEQVALLMEEV